MFPSTPSRPRRPREEAGFPVAESTPQAAATSSFVPFFPFASPSLSPERVSSAFESFEVDPKILDWVKRSKKLPEKPESIASFKKMAELLRKKEFEIETKKFSLGQVKHGNFKETYFFKEEEERTIFGEKASRYVLKVYLFNQLRVHSDREIENWTKFAMKQYHILKSHNEKVEAKEIEEPRLPIAKIYNDPLKDGYFLCERVEISYEELDRFTLDEFESDLTTLPEAVFSRLEQYRNFFIWGVKNKVALDLKMDNFGVDPKTNQLVLFDFYEEEEDTPRAFLNTNFKRFCKGNLHLKNFLIEPLKEINLKEYQFFYDFG